VIVCSAPDRVESEVVVDFVRAILAESGSAFAASEPGEQRTEQAVVLIGRDVECLVVDTGGSQRLSR